MSDKSSSTAVCSEESTFIKWWVWLVLEWLEFWHWVWRRWRSCCRSVAYARFGWGNHDYDYDYFLDALHFKLQRMHKYLLTSQFKLDKPTMQSLRLAVRLADKLKEHEYHYFCDLHDAKWGPLEMDLTPCEPEYDLPGGSVCSFRREKATTPRKKAMEAREFKKAVKLDEAARARDSRWLFSIMEKYHQHWWD